MSSADTSPLSCPRCGATLRRGGHLAGQCFVCLLESALEVVEVHPTNSERFDHYQVATHADGSLVELGRGAMGVTYKAVDLKKLIHRDIKPSNIMVKLDDGGILTAKIIDLGLAKTAEQTNTGTVISTIGSFFGTPEYSSPEQFAGFGVDIRSDLYSLGVTLWEMVTGRIPFQGTGLELMYHHQRSPLPLEQLNKLPQPIIILLESLLAKDPEWRFQRPDDLLRGLPSIREACTKGRLITDQSFRLISEPNITAATDDSEDTKAEGENCENISLYEHYFQGIALLEVGDPDANKRAVEHFKKGIPLLGQSKLTIATVPIPSTSYRDSFDPGILPDRRELIRKSETKSLVGVWQVNILPKNDAIPLLSVAIFGADGSFSTSTNRLLPPIPGIHAIATELGPGYGAWMPARNNEFGLTYYALLRNKQGRVSGFMRVKSTIILSTSGDQNTAEGEVDFLDANWNIVFSTTTTTTATRLSTAP
jgi:hypothetical protein